MIHLHIVTIIFPIEINIKINYNFINLFPPELLPNSVEQWVNIKYYLLDTHLKSLYLYH